MTLPESSRATLHKGSAGEGFHISKMYNVEGSLLSSSCSIFDSIVDMMWKLTADDSQWNINCRRQLPRHTHTHTHTRTYNYRMHVSDSYAGSPFLWPNKLSQAINVSAVPSFESTEGRIKSQIAGQKRKIQSVSIQAKSHWKDFTGISCSPLSRATASLSHEKWFLSFFPFIIKNEKKKWNGFFSSFLISRHSRRACNRNCSFKQDPLHPPGLLHWSSPAACWISISTTSCTAPSLQKVNAKVKLPKDNQKLYAAPSKSKVWAKQSAWAQRELRSFPTGFSSISLFFFPLFFTASAQYH